MTKSEACRLIAEKLEPLVSLVHPNSYIDPNHDREDVCLVYSPMGMWRIHFDPINGYRWKSVDFFIDESANARLLDAMPSFSLHFNSNAEAWVCSPDLWNHGRHYQKVESNDRKNAIVLAACKWMGIEGKLE